jgi:molybdopterin synthase sulfur carrier subunit
MKIYVKYFASIRDIMGTECANLDIEEGISVDELWQGLIVGKETPKKVLVAVNYEYVNMNYKLKEGDEIAFFPPVTGG